MDALVSNPKNALSISYLIFILIRGYPNIRVSNRSPNPLLAQHCDRTLSFLTTESQLRADHNYKGTNYSSPNTVSTSPGVPGIESAQCRCGNGEETPRHMALFCTEEAGRRQHIRVGGRLDYQQLIGTNRGAKALAEWMIRSGRWSQFSLARRLLYS